VIVRDWSFWKRVVCVLQLANKYTIEIDIKFGQLASIMHWCETQCIGNWRYDIVDMAGLLPGKYTFHFDNQADYVNFVLWKS